MGCNCGNKTKTVVSTVPTTTTELCSCGKPKSDCGKGTCGCNHEQKPCLEDHSVTLVESVYTTTVTATDTWVMPAVDDCVQLHLKDVTNILPGSILWNKSVGYLHVSSYDASSGYVTACNEGEDGNAEVGSTFPSCMSFHVGIPTQCTCDDGYTGACLAADVTSPGVGETTEVSVTTVSGLFIGDIIDIAGYMYKITAITDINTITVKNEGFGAPIGTVIKNDPNCTGKPCTVKITVVNSDDPCIKDPVNEGVIIVCDEGERKPFEGTADSQIAVWDNEVKKWKLRTVKIDNECTNITADVTLDPLITLYIVTVTDTSIFTVGDVVYFAGRRGKIDSKINSTQMRLRLDKAPNAITVIEEGEAICLGDCCENLPAKYSNVVTVPIPSGNTTSTSNCIVTEIDETLENTQENTKVVDSNPFTASVTIAVPSEAAGRKLTLVGNAVLTYQAIGFADTHYFAFDGGGTSWTGICYIIPPRVCLSGNVSITNGGTTKKLFPVKSYDFSSGGVNARLDSKVEVNYGAKLIDGLFVYNSFYATPTCLDGINNAENKTKTGPSKLPVTQTLVLPISITLDGVSSATVNVSGIISLLNARGILARKPAEGDPATQAKSNEQIKIRIRQTSIAYSLAWIIQ